MSTETMSTPTTSTERWLDSDKATAVAGLGFATTVILQNILRSAAPKVQASTDELVRYYDTHRATETLLITLFVFGATFVARFIGGLWTRLDDEPDTVRRWARAGVLGAAGILALFTIEVAAEIALLVGTDNPDLTSTVAPMWLLHNSIFSVLTLFVAIALFALSRASAAAGLISPVVRKIAVVGAGLLAASTMFAPVTVDHFSALSLVGPIGFIGWLTFVIAVSLRLRRD